MILHILAKDLRRKHQRSEKLYPALRSVKTENAAKGREAK